MTERRYTDLWVVGGILLAVALIAQVPNNMRASVSNSGASQMSAILGESRRVIIDQTFSRADLTAVLGGCRLDLRQAKVEPGQEMVVHILAVMGGVTIRVPDGWIVDTHAVPVLGGLKDQRVRRATDTVDPAAMSPAPRLILHGAVVMGQIRITS